MEVARAAYSSQHVPQRRRHARSSAMNTGLVHRLGDPSSEATVIGKHDVPIAGLHSPQTRPDTGRHFSGVGIRRIDPHVFPASGVTHHATTSKPKEMERPVQGHRRSIMRIARFETHKGPSRRQIPATPCAVKVHVHGRAAQGLRAAPLLESICRAVQQFNTPKVASKGGRPRLSQTTCKLKEPRIHRETQGKLPLQRLTHSKGTVAQQLRAYATCATRSTLAVAPRPPARRAAAPSGQLRRQHAWMPQAHSADSPHDLHWHLAHETASDERRALRSIRRRPPHAVPRRGRACQARQGGLA
jgi:hypothetical protein